MRISTLPFSGRFPSSVRFIDAPVVSGGGDSTEVDGDSEAEAVEEDSGESVEADDEFEGDEEGVDQLGDAGKQALDRMKQKWRDERALRRALEKQVAGEPVEDESVQADAQLQRANEKILRSEIKAAAAGKLADPADAYRFLDLTDFEVSEDLEVDGDEIAEAIDALLEKKPYLAAQAQGERRFKGGGGNGPRKGNQARQLTESDLDRMSPEQINTALREGRLNKTLGIS